MSDGVMVDGELYCCVHHAQADRQERERKVRRARTLTLPQVRKSENRGWRTHPYWCRCEECLPAGA